MTRRSPTTPRKGDTEILRAEAGLLASLTPEEAALLSATREVLRRRAEIALGAPGTPPPLPGTPEERAALRERVERLGRPSPARSRTTRAPRADPAEDFEDLGPTEEG